MNEIQLLSQDTIDKIAAGEVVERPSSVVKELVENAIDAGAAAVTVEIRDGGISLVRVTDNGCGIPEEQVRTAFLRHATSKIRNVKDLVRTDTLGFRGEALSSIAAVAQVEMITKTPDALLGVRYTIENGQEQSMEEIGAPDGTTILVRNLFYRTPARRKFLKSPASESGAISDLMERLALSHPTISFKLIINRENRLSTSGNGRMQDILFAIYGRDVLLNLARVDESGASVSIHGYIGKPVISRGNRNYENYYVNGRYVKNPVISRAIEDAYRPFLMNHRFPLTVLSVDVDPNQVDINVHPAKMEVRFMDQAMVYDSVFHAVSDALSQRELIPDVTIDEDRPRTKKQENRPERQERDQKEDKKEDNREFNREFNREDNQENNQEIRPEDRQEEKREKQGSVRAPEPFEKERAQAFHESVSWQGQKEESPPAQMSLFDDEKEPTQKTAKNYTLIGQVFDTYWIVECGDKLYLIDQHAAHEKVLYERFMRQLRQKRQTSQMITPPLLVSLSMPEEEMLKKHLNCFTEVGFEIEPFGGREYTISAVPGNICGIADEDLFHEMLDGLTDLSERADDESIREKLASMSCKAAVKGGSRLSAAEMDALIGELLTLDNPYNCPHGRPTIVSMSKYELDKKFKRIV